MAWFEFEASIKEKSVWKDKTLAKHTQRNGNKRMTKGQETYTISTNMLARNVKSCHSLMFNVKGMNCEIIALTATIIPVI